MFYYLQGPIAILEPNLAVVDCGGVGYACAVTAYTAAQLKLNQTARLYIHENIREDAFDLFGFASREELRCFQLLLGVNGVGPKAALSILSAGGPQSFTLAIMTGDEKALTVAQVEGGGGVGALQVVQVPPLQPGTATSPWPLPPCKSWAIPRLKLPPPSRAVTPPPAPRR